ncbi:MAG: extracellular solute-binding protein [Actinocatenispora sp.]
MRRTTGRVRSLALVGAVAVALTSLTTACGSGSDDGRVTLKVWDPGLLGHTVDGKPDPKRSFIHRAAAAYEKSHPKVTIKISETSGDISASSNQFRAASMARNGPDLRIGFTGGNTLSFSHFLEPLNQVFSPAERAKLRGWRTVTENYSAKGNILALPYGAGSYFYVFYNKKLLSRAHVDLSTPPSTWEDMLAVGKKVKAAGINPFWTTNQEGYVGAWVVAALVGGELGANAFTDMYAGKTSIDNPAMVKAYRAFAQLYSEGLTNKDAGSVANGQALSGFVQGKGAMMISGGWNNHDIDKALGDDVGAFPVPTLAGAAHPGILAGGPNVAVSVTSYTEHKEEANAFLKYLAQPKVIDQYVELSQTEASNSTDADASVITNPLLKQQAAAVKKSEAVFPFDNVMPQSVIDGFYRLNATVLTGQTSPQSAAKQLAADLKQDPK